MPWKNIYAIFLTSSRFVNCQWRRGRILTPLLPEGTVNFSWKTLAPELARPLLKGSVGALQLVSIADRALQLARDASPEVMAEHVHLAAQLLLAAWEGDMLDHITATQILELHQAYSFLDKAVLPVVNMVSACRPPANGAELHACLLARDTDQTLRYLESMRRKEPGNYFWLRQGVLVGMVEEKLDWVERWVSTADALPGPLQQGLLADVDFARGDWRSARGRYLAAQRGLPALVWRERLGEASWREGLREEALAQWDVVVARRPWHTNVLLRRDDVRRERDGEGPLPEGAGTVLLYSWNKAETLDMTLASLAASSLGDARILVLDNGSTDATAEVIAAWADRLGSMVRGISLPCNVGAPAARNWLLTRPEVRASQWVAYVDDDVELPPNWLRLLGKAMQEHPDHPVYGCRVVNHDTPMTLQSVDLHLDAGGMAGTPQGGERGQEPAHVRRFGVSGVHHQSLDFGSFSYMRPCVSVTGCCHLFRREALDEAGPFDVRFSPSQYDDLEHDIRHALRRQWPLYQGHLRIRHMKQSGRGAWRDSVQMMGAWANMFKLQTRYTQEEYDGIRDAEHALLLADMLARTEEA